MEETEEFREEKAMRKIKTLTIERSIFEALKINEQI